MVADNSKVINIYPLRYILIIICIEDEFDGKAAAINKRGGYINNFFGPIFVGYFLSGGEDGQWMQWVEPSTRKMSGYSMPMENYFRKWVRKKYKKIQEKKPGFKNEESLFYIKKIKNILKIYYKREI